MSTGTSFGLALVYYGCRQVPSNIQIRVAHASVIPSIPDATSTEALNRRLKAKGPPDFLLKTAEDPGQGSSTPRSKKHRKRDATRDETEDWQRPVAAPQDRKRRPKNPRTPPTPLTRAEKNERKKKEIDKSRPESDEEALRRIGNNTFTYNKNCKGAFVAQGV